MTEKLKVVYLDTRKVVKQGGSLYISIPHKFCDDNGIAEGASIDIYANEDGKVAILKRRETNFNEE